jgi:hypothetical protein
MYSAKIAVFLFLCCAYFSFTFASAKSKNRSIARCATCVDNFAVSIPCSYTTRGTPAYGGAASF